MKLQDRKTLAHLPKLEAHEIGRPKFRMRNPIVVGLGDYVVQPIWDFYGINPNVACVRATLFQVARGGQYTLGGLNFTKTDQTTSMTAAGELAAPERMLVRCASVFLDSEMNQLDVARFVSQVLLDFQVSTKSFLQLPNIAKAPGGGGAWAQQTTNANSVTGNGIPSSKEGASMTAPQAAPQNGDPFPEVLGVVIEQNQPFRVIVDPTLAAHVAAVGFTTQLAAATPPGIGVRAFIYLEGTKVRAVL